jgi:hypothetical protein
MNSVESVIILAWLVLIGCMLGVYVDIQEPKVYACSQVTKQDPHDVQVLCKKVRKYGD